MPFLEGHVLSATVPPALDGSRTEIGPALVEALAELHAVDVVAAGLSDFGKATGYLERQVCRFRQLLEHNRIRDLPDLERIADWLAAAMPASRETTVVHGDFRLGNVMFAAKAPPRVVAVLDWELAALGDPLADLGYLTAMWAQRDDPDNPMLDLSAVTRLPGFVDRDVLASSYSERTGRSVDALAWYQVLALWKSAIFLEGSYARFVAGTTDDRYFARLGAGIPQLAAAAWRWAQAA
jgi:aminoglycoside phosphotransferase (APT) family kinase protein